MGGGCGCEAAPAVGIEVLFFCFYVGFFPPCSRDPRTLLLLLLFAVVSLYPCCIVTVESYFSYLPLPRAALVPLQIESPLPKVHRPRLLSTA